jgi:SAM-dependent methyltransferase
MGVDLCEEMLAQLAQIAEIRPVHWDALQFSKFPMRCDKVLIKDGINYIEKRRQLFQNLYDRLDDDGVLLVVQLAPHPESPLFKEALRRWETWHQGPSELSALLENVGFHVRRDSLEYRHRIPKTVYCEMIENRYLSILSTFDDDEIRDGVSEIRERYAVWKVVAFTDHFDFITAAKHRGT